MSKLIHFPLGLLFSLLLGQLAFSQPTTDFSKKGEIHDLVINAWNTRYRDYYASEIQRRLFEDGDVYVLYDVQIGGLQSFVEMTRRCKDIPQIAELVDLLSPVFAALKPISGNSSSTGWICTGGNICKAYGLIGREVPLCSVQFLGLLGALATNVSENIEPRKQTTAQKIFLKETFNTMAVQLDRWLSPGYFSSVSKRLTVTLADIKDKNSYLFFTDRDLWYLTVLSDLSELHRWGVEPATADGRKAFESLQNKKENIQKIFDLFLARTFLTPAPDGGRAEIDKGFWKYHFDNRFAGYTDTTAPVRWDNDSSGQPKMQTLVIWDSSYLAPNAGWDISHARRLVPALETLVRNRNNIKKLWGYNNPAFDPEAIRRAYANQIAEKIWNGDAQYPLFSNFWSGDNGWYRVAYASQTGRQFIGYPPYGLSNSIPNGGYAVWGAFQPTLNALFKTIFTLSRKEKPEAKSFIQQHYRAFSGNNPNTLSVPSTESFSFLSDLVALPTGKTHRQR